MLTVKEARVTGIPLEKIGLSPSVNPMALLHEDEWFEFPGYFKKPAHTAIEVYGRPGAEGYKVVIATELSTNDGVSITNGSESLAAAICSKLDIMPQDLILIEHYAGDSILGEHYDLVRFTVRRERNGYSFEDRKWLPLDKSQLERLLGIEIY
jgi:hypothetical protein